MKVAILAGGIGSRLIEETAEHPKALVRIGDKPILHHIMAIYAAAGFKDFVVAAGYKADMLREYFDRPAARDWQVDVVDTGAHTSTGGRIKRLGPCLGGKPFMLTWCDGLSDIDPKALLEFHRKHGRQATVTVVHPPERFGRVELEGDRVTAFVEKPPRSDWINGAFFVLEPVVLDYIAGDDTDWERETMPRLAAEGQLMAYRHEGFWQCMDTVYERDRLEALWQSGEAPWRRTEPLMNADERG